ncbi:MAG: hypothetical protein HZA37_02020 [Parcubacteria group bacterium]|nr:hypothetical protein [Parcubacteria group bacterium]
MAKVVARGEVILWLESEFAEFIGDFQEKVNFSFESEFAQLIKDLATPYHARLTEGEFFASKKYKHCHGNV